ncbi:MAG: hypothetical protein HWE30_17840 [Methylocystaceae bacterium]|nr:hypothetical protein [Methylocystaceae bacterium]
MVKSRLKTILLASVISLSFTHSSEAAWPVTDATAIAKAVEQHNELKKQFEELKELKDNAEKELKALGEFGKITIPTFNAKAIGNQLKKDLQCLKPDLKDLMPELKTEEQMFSVCDKSRFYKDNMWVDPLKVGGKSVITDPTIGAERTEVDWNELEKQRQKVRQWRDNLSYDATTKGLGQADIALNNINKNSDAIDDLQATAENAEDNRQQLAAIAQGLVVNARVNNQNAKIMAQLLKVMSSYVMQATVPIDKRQTGEAEGDQK